jgi:hypothetical protein
VQVVVLCALCSRVQVAVHVFVVISLSCHTVVCFYSFVAHLIFMDSSSVLWHVMYPTPAQVADDSCRYVVRVPSSYDCLATYDLYLCYQFVPLCCGLRSFNLSRSIVNTVNGIFTIPARRIFEVLLLFM